jgi:hypothetical protein
MEDQTVDDFIWKFELFIDQHTNEQGVWPLRFVLISLDVHLST